MKKYSADWTTTAHWFMELEIEVHKVLLWLDGLIIRISGKVTKISNKREEAVVVMTLGEVVTNSHNKKIESFEILRILTKDLLKKGIN